VSIDGGVPCCVSETWRVVFFFIAVSDGLMTGMGGVKRGEMLW